MEETNAANAAKSTANAENQAPVSTTEADVDTDLIKALNGDTRSVNERLLQESKKYKEKYKEAREKLTEIEKARLEEQGKWKEAYITERRSREEMQAKLEAEQRYRTESRVKLKLQEALTKQSCLLQAEDLLALPSINREVIVYDEESDAVHGVDLFLEDLKKKKPGIFGQTKHASINPTQPIGAVTQKTLTPADVAKLPPLERQRVLVELERKRRAAAR